MRYKCHTCNQITLAAKISKHFACCICKVSILVGNSYLRELISWQVDFVRVDLVAIDLVRIDLVKGSLLQQ